MSSTPEQTATQRAQRSDGIRTRRAILEHAARLATVDGLEGLSIARLAESVGMSKSGLFAHFGSKEELQLATVDTAGAIFEELVVAPSRTAANGLERLQTLTEAFLRHLEEGVFPGGCFFASAAAELDTHPGPVRDRAFAIVAEWMATLVQAVRDAQVEGLLSDDVDAEQLAFELDAYLLLANAQLVAGGGEAPLARARLAIGERIARARSEAA